jgi:hypothetical protein
VNILKNAIGIAVLALWLVACASTSTSQPGQTAGSSTSSDNGTETEEKVCTYETGGRIGSPMRRVCRSVDTT